MGCEESFIIIKLIWYGYLIFSLDNCIHKISTETVLISHRLLLRSYLSCSVTLGDWFAHGFRNLVARPTGRKSGAAEKTCGLCFRTEAAAAVLRDRSGSVTGMEWREPLGRYGRLDCTRSRVAWTLLETCVAYLFFAGLFGAHLMWIRAKFRKKFLLISAKKKREGYVF